MLAQTGAPPTATPVQRPVPVTEFRPLRRHVGLFTGRGGTIGWLSSAAALAVIDTQFADTAAICLGGLPDRRDRLIDVVVNTHHHGDHTSGNKIFKPAAKMIAAQSNVPALMQAATDRAAASGRPFEQPVFPDFLFGDVWRKDLGDEVLSAQFFGPAHTGGDITVCFERANVVHLGDLVFNRIYPVIDRPGGGKVRRWIKVIDDIAETFPADALYIFGHGKRDFGVTGSKAELFIFRDYLTGLVEHVEKEIKAGKPRAEVVTLTNLPGFPDFHVEENSRLPSNLGAVYDELTGVGE